MAAVRLRSRFRRLMSTILRSAVPGRAAARCYLDGPVSDVLLMGGGSLLALLALRWAMDDAAWAGAWSAGTTLALANVTNNPPFITSYQLFYRGFGAKLT